MSTVSRVNILDWSKWLVKAIGCIKSSPLYNGSLAGDNWRLSLSFILTSIVIIMCCERRRKTLY